MKPNKCYSKVRGITRISKTLGLFFFFSFVLNNLKAYAYDFRVGGICYNITSATQLTAEVTYENLHYWNGSQYYACCYSGTVSIPESVDYNGNTYKVTGIGAHAFSTESGNDWADSYKEALKSIKLPEGLIYISADAFRNCDGLTELYLPSTINNIGQFAFTSCDNLQMVFVPCNTPPTTQYGSFGYNGSYGKCEIVVPQKELYTNDSEWSQYGDRLLELVTFDCNDLVYNGITHEIPWTNNLKSLTVEISNNQTSINAGKGTANISYICKKGADVVTSGIINYSYEIQKAPLDVYISNVERIYGDSNPDFEYTCFGFVNDEDLTVVLTNPTITSNATSYSDVGQYSITGKGGEALNYKFNFIDGKLTIRKAPLNAKVNDASREYGSSNPNFSLTFQGLKNGESTPSWTNRPTFETEATYSSAVGEYSVTATATPKNYELSSIGSGVLTVIPATLKVVANNKSRLYFEENPELTFYYSGFKNGESETVLSSYPSVSTLAKLESNVGKYDISVVGGSAPNYVFSYQTGTLSVNPRKLNVQVGNYERPYGEDNPDFELVYNGFVGGDNVGELSVIPTASTSANNTSNVGSYTIYVSGGEAQNYTFDYTSGRLYIVKAEQEILWNQDLSNLVVGDQVELTAQSTSGLAITYTLGETSVCELYSTGTRQYLDCLSEGEVQIRATQEGNQNYNSTTRVSKTIKIARTQAKTHLLTIKQASSGTISTEVENGSTYKFTITPEEGWYIHSVTYNDRNITSELDENNTFFTPSINANATLIIAYKENGEDGVLNVKTSPITVLGTSNGIMVQNISIGDKVFVYAIDGSLIRCTQSTSNQVSIQLPLDKVYIVKINGNVIKVRI